MRQQSKSALSGECLLQAPSATDDCAVELEQKQIQMAMEAERPFCFLHNFQRTGKVGRDSNGREQTAIVN